ATEAYAAYAAGSGRGRQRSRRGVSHVHEERSRMRRTLQMRGADRAPRLRRMPHTPQGAAEGGNEADGALSASAPDMQTPRRHRRQGPRTEPGRVYFFACSERI